MNGDLLLADDQCLSFELATKSVAAEIASHLFSEETRRKVKERTLCVYVLSLPVDRSTAIIGMNATRFNFLSAACCW